MSYTTPGTRLVSERDGHTITVGETVADFRGDPLTVVGWRQGSHPGSTGRVLVTEPGETSQREYFPGVIGARVEVIDTGYGDWVARAQREDEDRAFGRDRS